MMKTNLLRLIFKKQYEFCMKSFKDFFLNLNLRNSDFNIESDHLFYRV